MANSIKKAYNEAIDVYKNYLPQLQAKYNDILTNLQNEYTTATAKQTGLFGAEKTTLTNEIAKRGLTAQSGDTFFDTQQNSLASNQNVQSNDLLNKYQTNRSGAVASQNEATMGINEAIASLNKEKSAALTAEEWKKKEYKLTKSQQKKANEQWEKTFAYTQSKDAADRAVEMYKTNLGNKATDYEAQMRSDISSALSGAGNYAPYLRELITDTYKGKVSDETLKKYINTYMYSGWEDAAKRAAQ